MKNICFLFLFSPFMGFAQSPEQVLAKAVSYHDQNDNWPALSATFRFQEKRPTGADRSTTIILDNKKSYMKLNRNDEEVYEVNHEEAVVLSGDRGKERALVLRNYYLYLWGLPMKLYDESTPEITLSDDEEVDGVIAKVLRIAYEKDTWYFYFDASSGRMLQYKFYQDEKETKGELITLEDEIEIAGIKIPQKRSWYTLPDNKYLGTDILAEVK